jgi:hypothetical protein
MQLSLPLLHSHIVTSVLLVVFSTITQTRAGNYFHGVTAANSAPNSDAYRCRSQEEVSEFCSIKKSVDAAWVLSEESMMAMITIFLPYPPT